jgi:hypothetical protein
MNRYVSFASVALLTSVVAASCGGDDSGAGGGAPPDGGGTNPTTPPHDAAVVTVMDGTVMVGDATVPPPAATCTAPIQPVDVSTPTTVVRMCDEATLDAAVATGGIITFDCGGAATIPITKEIKLPNKTVTIDGGGMITIDGQSMTRLFSFDSGNFRATMTTFTFQHLTLKGGKSTGTTIPSAPPPCSQGTETDGGGAAILVTDGVLHVLDVTFLSNAAAALGPDVAGGGVYGIGSLDVTIVGSTFAANTASNGGAVGSLFSNLTLYNDTFVQNQALGMGENTIDTSTCHTEAGEVGNGGNGAAVSIDGGEAFTVTVCGCDFEQNSGGGLGTISRTPDIDVQTTNIDRCTFSGNTQTSGGGALYFHHSTLDVTSSTFTNNSAPAAGAIQADDTTLNLTNDTFVGNSATHGAGGAIALFSNAGTITNCTFDGNHADAGSGNFAAAIFGSVAFTVSNTVFADQTSQDGNAPMTCQTTGTGTADFQWPVDHTVSSNPDQACVTGITFADPKLGTLADNGGPVETIAPMAGSPLLGAGKACPATDARGTMRKQPDGCTVGAYEAP